MSNIILIRDLFIRCGYLHLTPMLTGFEVLEQLPKKLQSIALLNFEECIKFLVDIDTYTEFEFIIERVYDELNIPYAN